MFQQLVRHAHSGNSRSKTANKSDTRHGWTKYTYSYNQCNIHYYYIIKLYCLKKRVNNMI